jgi:acyl-CoA synthetase (NDP forming)/GNAT superfamily N-acetyltransferase
MDSVPGADDDRTAARGSDRSRWATGVVLADGEPAWVRPIEPTDRAALLAFHERQPREDLYRRFFSPKPTLTSDELRHFTEIDFVDRVALVVEVAGEFAAWASYERWPGRPEADVAFMVDHDRHGTGIATLLLEHLAAIARSNGVRRFTADVLADNRAMLGVFSRAGWPVRRHLDSGVVELDWDLDDTAKFLESVEAREQRADTRSMARLLFPRSIAVVGASDRPGSVGAELWRSATRRSAIPVHAVNPNRATVDGRPCVASVADIDDEVGLAVVACPPAALAGVIDDCLAKRVRAAVLVTAADHLDIDATVARARRAGMRIVGPSSMGIAAGGDRRPRDGAGSAAVQALLVPIDLPGGTVACSLQSGSLGASVLHLADRLGMGFSWFVSLGDKRDVSGNDLLQFWEGDDRTSVIAMYSESFGNPRKFARVARRVGRTKPIIAVRTGAARTDAADALYEHAGLVEVPTVHGLLDTARVAASQPLPAGDRVVVLTNSRSPGVLARAALERAGMRVEVVDTQWSADPSSATHAIAGVLARPDADVLMLVHAPPVSTASAPEAAILDACHASRIPVVAVLLGRDDAMLGGPEGVPAFSFPEAAAAAIGALWRHQQWRRLELADAAEQAAAGGSDDVDERGRAIDAIVHGAPIGRLDLDRTTRLLAAVGIELAPARAVDLHGAADHPDERLRHALTGLAAPYALKADARRPGRSAAAGVALDLPDADAVVAAWSSMRTSLGDDALHLVVQQMVPPGIDVRVRCRSELRTGTIGPVVSVGLGGVAADAIGDELMRLAPVGRATARHMIEHSRAGAALAEAAGARDDDRAQIDALIESLVDVVVAVSMLAAERPDLAEIDLNPVLVSQAGALVVDARIETMAPPMERPLRQLT